MVTTLQPDEVFVYGSNQAGIHAGGAAKLAHDKFGALMGSSTGTTGGQTYGIVTLDFEMKQVPVSYIREQLGDLVYIARANPGKTFLLTPIGTGIAGFDKETIASLVDMANMPDNVQKVGWDE